MVAGVRLDVEATSAAVRALYTLLFQDSVLRYYTGELTVPETAAQ